MQTYTAGEDQGRLAMAAKSFGLAQARQPRKQIRLTRQTSVNRMLKRFDVFIKGLNYEDARMKSTGFYDDEEYDSDDQSYVFQAIEEERANSAPDNTFDMLLGGITEVSDVAERSEEYDAIPEEEPDDEIHEDVPAGGTLSAAVFGIVKGMVGPAILYLPHGFADGGYAIALPALFLTTALFLYSSNCLLTVWKLETIKMATAIANEKLYGATGKKKKMKHLSYPRLAGMALGKTAEKIVMNGIAGMQLGVCLTYFIFVPQNLRMSLQTLFGITLPFWVYLFIMVLVQIPLSWITDIRKLTVTNVLANFLILFGLITCLYFAFTAQDLPNLFEKASHLDAIRPNWCLFIGTAVLLFEGSITLAIPLQEAVEGNDNRTAFPKVYRNTISSIIVFYCIFGSICWTAFGDSVHTVLTTSLPEGALTTCVQFAYSLAVIFTFPLQAYPAQEILVRLLMPASQKKLQTSSQRNIMTSSIVIALSIVALVEMDNLGHVVSLMGSLLGCPIAFVFPPLIYDRLQCRSGSKNEKWRFANWTVAMLGLVGMVGASYTTLISWNSVGPE